MPEAVTEFLNAECLLMTTIRQLGERALIKRLGRLLPQTRGVIVGIGDDCAIVRTVSDKSYDLVLTSDPVIEGVHFAAGEKPLLVGRKAAGRVLSDLAAVGAEPLWALVDLVAPADTPVTKIEGIYRGLAGMAGRHGLTIVGGDTAGGACLELHVFAVGRVPHGRAILRSGAKPEDVVFVTGSLGGSRAGKHLRFEPRLAQGQWIRARGAASSMIDLSDGMASDLRRVAEMSGTGALINLAGIPVSTEAMKGKGGRSPLSHALFDGEDYELLFTVPVRKAAALERAWRTKFTTVRLSRVGSMTAGRGNVKCVGPDGRHTLLKDGGYEHFIGSDT
ncbi:MAG: thiamine-phosphate kinase [bacterium]